MTIAHNSMFSDLKSGVNLGTVVYSCYVLKRNCIYNRTSRWYSL